MNIKKEIRNQPNSDDWQSDFFSKRSLIIASNRGPVTFKQNEQGDFQYERGTGGLVTALTGLARQTNATWISCAHTEADSAWQEGKINLTENGNTMQVNFLTPEQPAYDGYYNKIANPLLWFLQHSMWDVPRTPIIDRETWKAWENGYVPVNQLFAEQIVSIVRSAIHPALVMLQDYHLYLVARFIYKQMRPKERPKISHFIHIPWPGPEYWSVLPSAMRHLILDGLCAVDLLGFQTYEDGLNFIRTCESHLPKTRVNYKKGRVWYRNHATYIRDFPISIDVQTIRSQSASSNVIEHYKEIQALVGDRQLLLRVDRIEPSKNIVRGFLAFEELLEHYPEHCGKVKFLAILVPSRMDVSEYQDYLDEIMAVVGRINATYGSSGWEPVRLLVGEDYPRAMAAMQLYDVLLVNAIADGMNLVAKEGPIVNQRHGVLILSERAGASQQLSPNAIIISPCDIYSTALAIHQTLTMSADERKERASKLRSSVEREDIKDWLYKQIQSTVDLNL
jgi:trehalose 6-phosphate synthase